MSTYPVITTSTGSITLPAEPGRFTVWPGTTTYTCTGVFPEIFNSKKEPMLEPQLCPLCNNHAVRDDDGNDEIVTMLRDHTKPAEADKPRNDKWKFTGMVFRVRICATCGHIWASRTAPAKEQACAPAK